MILNRFFFLEKYCGWHNFEWASEWKERRDKSILMDERKKKQSCERKTNSIRLHAQGSEIFHQNESVFCAHWFVHKFVAYSQWKCALYLKALTWFERFISLKLYGLCCFNNFNHRSNDKQSRMQPTKINLRKKMELFWALERISYDKPRSKWINWVLSWRFVRFSQGQPMIHKPRTASGKQHSATNAVPKKHCTWNKSWTWVETANSQFHLTNSWIHVNNFASEFLAI